MMLNLSSYDHLCLSASHTRLLADTQSGLGGRVQPLNVPPGQTSSESTTVVLRNFSKEQSQHSVREWVDNFGYAGLYDFLLFVPTKLKARLNSFGYALVNFRRSADAQRFKRQAHLMILPVEANTHEGTKSEVRLSVVVAKVQGFAENYARYRHHLDGSTPQFAPFFAPDKLLENGASPTISPPSGASPETDSPEPETALPEAAPHGNKTTIVIRILPNWMDCSDSAREWLDGNGFAGLYDFFMYFPVKRPRSPQVSHQ